MNPKSAVALALCVMAFLSACGSDPSEPEERTVPLDQARSFGDFTLYYLGESFEDLPLTSADLGPGSGAGLRRAWSFIYGDCRPPGGEGGCAPPLEVQSWSICTRFPALYSSPAPETSPLNGVETLRAGGGLDIYTGRTTVVIFGGDKAAIAGSLKRVTDDISPDTLPRPAPGALEGELPCQAKTLRRFSR